MNSERSHPRALLDAAGLRPKKRFGQNFLMDGKAAQRIARLCLDGAPGGIRIVEVGPGTGALTHALVDLHADVTAIEIDAGLVELLRARDDLASTRVEHHDALTFDYAPFTRAPWRVAGNLPYNVGTALLVQFIEMIDGPDVIVAMLQKDVVDRLAARPGTPAYGSLSIATQYAMRVERAFTLGPRAFYPSPKVDSTVVRLTRLATPAVATRDPDLFKKVVRAAFAYRRKTLSNSVSLALGTSRESVSDALVRADLAPEIRGEQLSLDDFARLADELAKR